MIHRLSTGQSISVASPDKTFRLRSGAPLQRILCIKLSSPASVTPA
jgi:hypothetical protein